MSAEDPSFVEAMLWIVQEDLDTQNRRGDLLGALERLGIPFLAVKVSRNKIEPDVPDDGRKIITNGSIMLSNIARERGWSPGSRLNESFNYEVWADKYQDMILNKGASVSSLRDAKMEGLSAFARPILDNKSFNGRVFSREEFAKMQSDSLSGAPGSPSPDMKILLSVPKMIGQEHRHYIVDGEIVSSSRYKLAGRPNFQEGADERVLRVVRQAIARWVPARAFVLDTYIAGDEVGIMEVGCICHAGLYEADIMRLASSLDALQGPAVAAMAAKPKIGR